MARNWSSHIVSIPVDTFVFSLILHQPLAQVARVLSEAKAVAQPVVAYFGLDFDHLPEPGTELFFNWPRCNSAIGADQLLQRETVSSALLGAQLCPPPGRPEGCRETILSRRYRQRLTTLTTRSKTAIHCSLASILWRSCRLGCEATFSELVSTPALFASTELPPARIGLAGTGTYASFKTVFFWRLWARLVKNGISERTLRRSGLDLGRNPHIFDAPDSKSVGGCFEKMVSAKLGDVPGSKRLSSSKRKSVGKAFGAHLHNL
ncbi:unnamed protein product [Protopolystoma xenopodis]|uniref:Uncharacterized protein n=1 Tax=Protopolystoma xenopodis TaxID=117903 RepID=A0A448XRH5_9PLAT|nr:unnamed protein product [Protopolystoma xenopodis]